MSQAQQPSVGRIVHYTARGSADGRFPPACRAAIVTEVDQADVIGLCAINPTGLFFHALSDGGVSYDPGPQTTAVPEPGTWHWPERVGP